MPYRILQVGNGLVTSRDPSLLADGELTRADDAYYKPNNPGLWKVRGRTAFNSAEASAIRGLRFLEYDGTASDMLVAAVGTKYREAVVGVTGGFADAVTGLTGSDTLDSVHYNGVHYLLNGVDRNRARDATGAWRYHGMLANTTAPTYTNSGVGTGFTLSSGITITYWVEERVKSGTTILRRNAENGGTKLTITGTGVLIKPVITRPAQLNPDATHWALFGTAAGGAFPTGAEIAEVAIATTGIEDTRTGTDPLLPGGSLYDIVTVTIEGVNESFARNGEPPIATTGDIFEDSLVLNDVSDASRIRYSDTDNPDAFPAVNFIRFETKEQDEVKMIRTLGRSIIIGLRDAMWRVDTLPRPEDSAFQIERVKEQIYGAHGCVGPLAAATFSFGQGIRLAYVSRYGILVTDGFQWDVLTDDVDWPNLVEVSQLGNAVLTNNPREWRLELDYTPLGGTSNTAALFLHYHPSHAKSAIGGGLRAKLSGPIHRAARCAVKADLAGEHRIYTGNSNGIVYFEDNGNSDTSGAGGISMVGLTGDIYIAGVGKQARVPRTFVHHQAAPGQTVTARLIEHNENEEDANETDPLLLTKREMTASYKAGFAEAFQFGFENSDSLGQVCVDYLVAQFLPEGDQKQGGGTS